MPDQSSSPPADAGPTDAAGPPDPGPHRYLNRELSWLDFNQRVLTMAEDLSVPLLERAKFVAIFSSNMDEFFQVRVAGLKEQVDAGLGDRSPDGLSASEQLRAIRGRVEELIARQGRIFVEQLVPALGDTHILLSDWDSLDDDDRKYLVEEFEERIFPVLTPLAVDPGHPFPHISSLSLNLAVLVRNPRSGERRFARVKVPPLLPRFVVMPDGERFVALEDVIAAHLGVLFPGMEVESHFAFRVTRNADLALEEGEADDLLEAIDSELRRRRFGRAVRLEINPGVSDEVRELLLEELELGPGDVYEVSEPLDLSGLSAVHAIDRPDLKDNPWAPVTPPALVGTGDAAPDVFALLRENDVLVHHPYESFSASVETFIEQAAVDPRVLAIKQTLYRTSGDSPIVEALIDAAERGKQVVVLIELKARGDEQANIAWARALEKAGVHVLYGLVGLKTHTKTALVVREEDEGVRRLYCHVGTGNYNPKTARLYEDLGLLTSDPDLGADLTHLFNYLTGYSEHVEYRKLLVANATLRARLTELIRAEGEDPEGGRIVLKMNSLVDQQVIDALYEASAGGASIDLIVRGICCLRPGVEGLSENIRVRSVVGRYLEHSRIFAFGGREERNYYIGSADLMPRNLDRRVEAVTPVDDPGLKARLQEILDVNMGDDRLAWTLGPDGCWTKVEAGDGWSTHDRLQELAVARARPAGSEAERSLP